jgi:hypothetical protein
MPVYTFYPCRADGSSTTFEAFEADGDAEAQRRAAELLQQHSSCAYVTIWQSDRLVLGPPAPVHAESF